MKFWFEGDTVFGDYIYKKVYMQSGDSIADFSKVYYFAAIREDTIAEKVYFHYSYYDWTGYCEDDFLLCDFSVKAGDKVNFFRLWPFWIPEEQKRDVYTVDSILIDNQYRKRINFRTSIYTTYIDDSWIEGIGSTHGLFFAGIFDVMDVMDNTYLLCVHEDGRLIYSLNNTCYWADMGGGGNITENKNELIKIYPGIVDDLLYFETNKNIDDFDYKIINIQGQIINFGTPTSNSINVSNLNKGFYIIVFSDKKNSKNVVIEKFIKN